MQACLSIGFLNLILKIDDVALLTEFLVFQFSDLADQEDFTKYIPQQDLIDDTGRVRMKSEIHAVKPR